MTAQASKDGIFMAAEDTITWSEELPAEKDKAINK